MFKINPSIIKITQAFWQLDHGDFSVIPTLISTIKHQGFNIMFHILDRDDAVIRPFSKQRRSQTVASSNAPKSATNTRTTSTCFIVPASELN